jgi:hypothetical protein
MGPGRDIRLIPEAHFQFLEGCRDFYETETHIVVPTPATSTGFRVVAQFSNASFAATTAITDNDIWAVGGSGASDILKGISADASNDIRAGGDSFSGGPAVILHFDGTNWSRVATPRFPQGFSSFNSVTALSPSDVWAAGIGKFNNKCCPHG